MLKQAMKNVRQHFIRAVTHKHLSTGDTVIVGNFSFQRICIGRGIETQAVIQLSLNGLGHAGRRTIGVFVGIELDQVFDFRLLTRNIRHQLLDEGAPETTHRAILINEA